MKSPAHLTACRAVINPKNQMKTIPLGQIYKKVIRRLGLILKAAMPGRPTFSCFHFLINPLDNLRNPEGFEYFHFKFINRIQADVRVVLFFAFYALDGKKPIFKYCGFLFHRSASCGPDIALYAASHLLRSCSARSTSLKKCSANLFFR